MKNSRKTLFPSVILFWVLVFSSSARTTKTAGSVALGNLSGAISQYAKDTNGSLPRSWDEFKNHCDLCMLAFRQADQYLDVTRRYAWVPNAPEVTIRGNPLRLVVAPIGDETDKKTVTDSVTGRAIDMPGRRVVLMDASLNTKLEWFPEAEFQKLLGSVGLGINDLSVDSEKKNTMGHGGSTERATDPAQPVDEFPDKGRDQKHEATRDWLPSVVLTGGVAVLLLLAILYRRWNRGHVR